MKQTIIALFALLILPACSSTEEKTESSFPLQAYVEMIKAALSTGSVISHISNIPFQAIDFTGDEAGAVFEDDLIAFAWLQFLEGGATEDLQAWLPRFPMTRAVVRAMNVVQEICESNQQQVFQ